MVRQARHARRRRWIFPVVVVLLWLFVGGPLGSFAGRLAEVQKNDNASFLPQSAESTGVLNEFLRFTGQESLPDDRRVRAPGRADRRGQAGHRRLRGRSSHRSTHVDARWDQGAGLLPRRDSRPGRRADRRPRTASRSRRRSPTSATW